MVLVGHSDDGEGRDISVVVEESVSSEIVIVFMVDGFSVAISHVAVGEVLFNSKSNTITT